MNRMPTDRAERAWLFCARLLLPHDFMTEARAELLEVLRDARADAARRGRVASMVFWLRTAADLCVTAIAEQTARRRSAAGARRDTHPERATPGTLRLDLAAAIREIRNTPGATTTAVLTLGLGIGATVLLLVLIRGVLDRPLPFHDADRLVRLREQRDDGATFWPSFPNILDWREQADVQAVIAADVGTVRTVLFPGDQARRATIGRVSRGFFQTLGTRPVAGRDFRDDDHVPASPATALIAEELWRGSLGSRPLDGIRIELGTEILQVVGVIPRGFRFLGHGDAWIQADVWTPLERETDLGERQSHGYHAIARLRPDTDLASTRTALDALARRLADTYGHGATDAHSISVQPLAEAITGSYRTPLRILLAAALATLAVACLNLGAGLLARGIDHERDLAVRAALGARRRDLVRLQITHATLLALPGAAAGILIANAGLHTLRILAGNTMPRLDGVTLQPGTALAATGIALLTALAAGAFPALALARTDLAGRFRTHGATSHGRGQNALWDAFVAGQVALTLALLTTAALLGRSLLAVIDVDPGYRTADIAIGEIALPESRFDSPGRRTAFVDALLQRLNGHPDIARAGMTTTPPDEIFTLITSSTRRPGAADATAWSGFRLADPGFFQTLEIPVAPTPLDHASDAILIDSVLARRLWGTSNPVGDRITSSFIGDTVTIAGIAGPVRSWDGPRDVIGYAYMHYARRPGSLLHFYIVARGRDMAGTADIMRDAVRATDPLATITIEPLQSRTGRSMAGRRLTLAIAAGFALTTLLLASAGVHALIARAAARRHHETGIRLILGATPAAVRRRTLSHGMRATAAGLVLGSGLSWIATRAIGSQLFGISRFDPPAVLAATLLLLAAAALAAWLPARRASRTDPAELLRRG